MPAPPVTCDVHRAVLLRLAEHAWNDSGCEILHEYEGNKIHSAVTCVRGTVRFGTFPWRDAGPRCEDEAAALAGAVETRLKRLRKLQPDAVAEAEAEARLEAMVETSFLGSDPVDVRWCRPPDIPQLQRLEKCVAENTHVGSRAWSWDGTCGKESEAVTAALDRQANLYGRLVKYEKAGVHRRTHKLGNLCVLKVAKSASGAAANREEYAAWREILATENPDFVNLFVPIRKMGPSGAFVVAKRVTPLESLVDEGLMQRDEAEEIAARMDHKVVLAGGRCKDVHYGNVGIDEDGEYRILDYGFGVTCPVKPAPRPELESVRLLHEEFAKEREDDHRLLEGLPRADSERRFQCRARSRS